MDEPQHPRVSSVANSVIQRSEIAAFVEGRLRSSGYLAMQNLSCEYRAGVLTLREYLPSYYLKQIALALLATVDGVQRIDDQIQVSRS